MKKVLHRMGTMCEAAWTVFHRCMQLGSALLASALLLTTADPLSAGYTYTIHLAGALFEAAEIVLLIAALLPVIIEDQKTRR